ncbi:MAG TPA: glycosyltransferase family 39 protein [Phycisphaerales bacterium]|nr:glycosyltransferase family 39 protein [Phycisphaerales bacterium]
MVTLAIDREILPPPPHRLRTCALIFVFTLAIRLLFLFTSPDRDWPHNVFHEGDAPIWIEYAAALDAHQPFEFNLPIHPPGVAYTLHFIHQIAPDQFSEIMVAKLVWCCCSALTPVFLYLAAGMIVSNRAAVIASMLCAGSFSQYVLATSLNSEAPYALLLMLIVFLSLHAARSSNLLLTIPLGLFNALATLFRPEHTLFVLLLCLWLAVFTRRIVVEPASEPVEKFNRYSPFRNLPREPVAVAPQRVTPQLLRPCVSARSIAIALLTIMFSIAWCLPWSLRASKAIRTFNSIAVSTTDFSGAPVTWTQDARVVFASFPLFARTELFNYANHRAIQLGYSELTGESLKSIFLQDFHALPRPLNPLVLVSNQGELSFALANHPGCEGGFSRAALEHPLLKPDPNFDIRFPPHLALLNDGFQIAFSWIRQDPIGWFQLVGKKFIRFGEGASLGLAAGNYPFGHQLARNPVDIATPHYDSQIQFIWPSCLAVLFIVGLLMSLRFQRASVFSLIILYKILVTVLYYGYARQAVSIAPVFAFFFALPIDAIFTRFLRPQNMALDNGPIHVVTDGPSVQRKPKHVRVVACAFVFAVIASDIYTAIERKPLYPHGSYVSAPQFGSNAFVSFSRIELGQTPSESH